MRIDLNKLRRHMARWTMKPRHLAKLSGVHESTLWRYFHISPFAKPETVQKLADAMLIAPEDLLEEPT